NQADGLPAAVGAASSRGPRLSARSARAEPERPGVVLLAVGPRAGSVRALGRGSTRPERLRIARAGAGSRAAGKRTAGVAASRVVGAGGVRVALEASRTGAVDVAAEA